MKKITPHTTLAAMTVAAFMLAACGAESPSASSPTETLPAPVETPGDGDGLRVPTLITVNGGGSSGGVRATVSAESTSVSGGASFDSSFAAPFFQVEYRLGDVGELPSDSTGYLFEPGVTVLSERVGALAAALGVSGEPVAGRPDRGTQWQVGPDDGSAPALFVGSDALLGWWYSSSFDERGTAIEACAVSIDESGVQSEDCPEPTPPVGVPTADEAEAMARDILQAAGFDLSVLRFESVGDQWFANVRAVETVPGFESLDHFETPFATELGFGPNAKLQWANGTFAKPVAVGPYPLVDVDTAFTRLQDNGYYGGGFFGVDVAESNIAVSSGDAAVSGLAVDAPEGGVVEPATEPIREPDIEPVPEPEAEPPVDLDPVEIVPVEPLPVDVEPGRAPEPEIMVVTLVDVESDVWWAFDEHGSVWLLPAYRFIGDDGGFYVVPAVTDEFLIVVEQESVDEPLPLNPETPIAVPAPPPEEPIAVPIDTNTPVADPGLLEEFIGLTLQGFIEDAAGAGYSTRVVSQDGEALAVTADFSETRANVAVESGVVVSVESIG
jgi:hypothetical protein